MLKLCLIFLLLSSELFAYRILGLGSPCIDYIVSIEEEALASLELEKGGWQEIDAKMLHSIIENSKETFIFTGDCTSNTIKGLATLGIPCALTGNVGNDFLGEKIRKTFTELGVTTLFTETQTPTSQIACLITPDGERSFCAFVQAEHEISESDLSPSHFDAIELVYLEGYRFLNGTFVEKACRLTKESGAILAIDLANAYLIEKYRERIWSLLTHYTDLLFVNKQEAYALTHLPPKEAAKFLNNFCKIVVVKVGRDGCWISSEEGLFHSPAMAAKVVNTAGAGDLFASAFLYSYLEGYALETCAYFGNLAGSATVEGHGAELSRQKWSEILEKIDCN